MSGRPDLRSLDMGELTALMKELGQPAFRAKQIFRQVQKHGAVSFDEMTDLPFAFRHYLAEAAELATPQEIRRQISTDGETAKLLLELADGVKIEMALMLYRRLKARDRATCCVSSQSGCAMGCRFCATGLTKDFRNLTAGEIVAQAQAGNRLAGELGADLARAEEVRRSKKICNCKSVDLGTIEDAIKAHALTTVEGVREHTHASGGCGACSGRIEEIFEAMGVVAAPPPAEAAPSSQEIVPDPLAAEEKRRAKKACGCKTVTVGTLENAVQEKGLRNIAEVRAATEANTGCGNCKERIETMLDDLLEAPSSTLEAAE